MGLADTSRATLVGRKFIQRLIAKTSFWPQWNVAGQSPGTDGEIGTSFMETVNSR